MDEPAASPGLRAAAHCPRCAARFRCGIDDDGACWCTALPSIDPAALAALDDEARAALGLPGDPLPAACLCPACLAAIAAALDGHEATSENAVRAACAAPQAPERAGSAFHAPNRTKETPPS